MMTILREPLLLATLIALTCAGLTLLGWTLLRLATRWLGTVLDTLTAERERGR